MSAAHLNQELFVLWCQQSVREQFRALLLTKSFGNEAQLALREQGEWHPHAHA